jgi:uncharacterized membrane protein YfhO
MRRLVSDEFDPMRQVILDTSGAVASKTMSKSTAEIARYGNNQIQIKTQLSDPGILVLADAYYPGWKVYVDGNEGKILRANYFFRAVELGAGRHNVEFIYLPFTFKLGLAISLATAGFLVIVSILCSIRHRKQVVQLGKAARPATVPLRSE